LEANFKKVEKMLTKYTEKDNIDIVMLPELALTGYLFKN
jgi:predicted amidohydrolase